MLQTVGYMYERLASKQLGKNPAYLGIPFVAEWVIEKTHTIHSQATAIGGLYCALSSCQKAYFKSLLRVIKVLFNF